MNKIKKVFYFDTETTGLDNRKHDIIQLAYLIEIDNEIVDEGNYFIKPRDFGVIDEEALKVNNLTIAQLKEFPSSATVYRQLHNKLNRYVDKYNKKDKFSPAGYNVGFDTGMLKSFFIKNGDNYYGSFFNYHIIDPINFLYLLEYKGILKLENYKLGTVCKYFDIKIKAHDALSDIKATRELIKKLMEYVKK